VGAAALAFALTVNPFPDRTSITILALGADAGADGPPRSDTLLVGRVDLGESFKVRAVAVPRDTRVSIPGHGRHRVNAAMAMGGPALTRRTLAENFDLQLDRQLVVSPQAMGALVDAAGGVTIHVSQRMSYEDVAQKLVIDLQPGTQRLTGDQAVQYLRWRGDGLGDLGRIARQRELLRCLAVEAARPDHLLRWPGMVSVVRSQMQTDLSVREALYLGGRFLRAGSSCLDLRRVPFRLSGPYVRLKRSAIRTTLEM
jgi:LCP family protein required for cell wall assembly